MEKPQPNRKKGKLFLIPTGLGGGALLEVLPLSVKKIVEEVDFYIAENEKTARQFIKRLVPNKSQPSLHFNVLNKFTKDYDLPNFIKPCKDGINVGLLSEAGCPGIADPGAQIVELAHQHEIKVVPLVGPSSILLAMMASGLNGQNFAFHGYLPIDKLERKRKIKQLEKISGEYDQAQIFIETPYRNEQLLEDFKTHLHSHTKLCVAREITQKEELILTKKVLEWKKAKISLNKKPTIFIFQKEAVF